MTQQRQLKSPRVRVSLGRYVMLTTVVPATSAGRCPSQTATVFH